MALWDSLLISIMVNHGLFMSNHGLSLCLKWTLVGSSWWVINGSMLYLLCWHAWRLFLVQVCILWELFCQVLPICPPAASVLRKKFNSNRKTQSISRTVILVALRRREILFISYQLWHQYALVAAGCLLVLSQDFEVFLFLPVKFVALLFTLWEIILYFKRWNKGTLYMVLHTAKKNLDFFLKKISFFLH